MNIHKIHSISKKICVAFLGGFLLVFLLFHATANLFILRHDGGEWYSAFCHFMGTNWIVKIFEIVLLAFLALHILLTVWLAIDNRMKRPVRYHHPSRTKTHTTSKLMVWTGILIFACLLLHFTDFYFVKTGITKGVYMTKTANLESDDLLMLQQVCMQQGVAPADAYSLMEMEASGYASQLGPEEQAMLTKKMEQMKAIVPVCDFLNSANQEGRMPDDKTWIRNISEQEKAMLEEALGTIETEPDFYCQAREKFSNLHIVISYLFFFAVVLLHLLHAFPSAFQTLGLNNYKYNNIIEILGRIYAWGVTLAFALVPILVYLGQ